MKIGEMTDVEEVSCRFCLKNITNKGFQVIDSATKDTLDVLLLKMKFSCESKEIICNDCIKKLNAAVEFKSTCLNTDNTIMLHVDYKEMLQLDLGEVYVKWNGRGDLKDVLHNHKICRLCMRLINDEIRSIGVEELQAINKFIPEMFMNIIKDPVLCKLCFHSLNTHNTFLKDCLEVERSITDIFESSASESRTDTCPADLLVKNEYAGKESEVKDEEMVIKTECIDIKSENEEASDTSLHSNNEAFEHSDYKDVEQEEGLEHMSKHKDISIEISVTPDEFPSSLYKCDKCTYKSKSERRFRTHCTKHKKVLEVYKCETCQYETKQKALMKSHKLTHKDPSEVQMYKCNNCSFEARHRYSLARHVLQHKDPSQIQMYKCDACDYESRYKGNFTKHQMTHKNSSEVKMYKCNECDYKSKIRYSLTCHVLQHKDPSQQQIYRCNDCDYKTILKRNIKCHVRIHQNLSPVQLYKCEACDYETKHRGKFARHQLKHKNSSRRKCRE